MKLATLSLVSCTVFVLSALPLIAQTSPPGQITAVPTATQPTPPKSRPEVYGTSVISYVQIPAAEFLPEQSSSGYSSSFPVGPRWNTYVTGGNLVTGLHLPSGAMPVYMELDFVDTNPNLALYGYLAECDYRGSNCTQHPAGGGGPADCLSLLYICSGTAFSAGGGFASADLTADALTIDNYGKHYILGTTMAVGDSSLEVAGMIVGYVLQVSPAPATATFNDVPVSDAAFRYIEAFNAAAITAGCNASPPLYCPDAFVTRRQMAVFFAKALGLEFP